MQNNVFGLDARKFLAAVIAIAGLVGAAFVQTSSATAGANDIEISPGLVMPRMDPVKGKALFASKGCVVCHAVNGVGGSDAPPIDASTMKPKMSPFDFVARMWNHSAGMIAMQQSELGGQILFDNGQQIADIIAFLHDADVQRTFSEGDIPADIKTRLDEGDEGSGGMMMKGNMGQGMGHGSMMSGGKMMQGN